MRSLAFESLEKRRLLAGDVSVIVDGTTLEVLGDHESNGVFVKEDGANLIIQSTPGSSSITTFNGGQSSVSIAKSDIDLFMANLGLGAMPCSSMIWTLKWTFTSTPDLDPALE